MNFQEKLLEASAELRARAAALADRRPRNAPAPRDVAAKRVEVLKGSFATLNVAGRELNKVARRHAVRFVKQNSTIAAAVRKDVSALARTTYASLASARRAEDKARRATRARKRATQRPPDRPPVAGHTRLATPSAPRMRGALFFAFSLDSGDSQIC